MPELPEVAAHAERLSGAFSGASLVRFEQLHPAALKTFDPGPSAVEGHVLSSIGHRGKYLLLHLGAAAGDSATSADGAAGGGATSGEFTFVVHLMQAGRLRAGAHKARKPRGAMVRWTFSGDRALLLTEAGTERRAGVWLVAGDPFGAEPLVRLGPDADTISRDELGRRLAAASERVHGFLRNQSHLAGIGRLLANEALHAARISPFANSSRLDEAAVDRLHAAIGASIRRGLDAERGLGDMGRSTDRPNDVHHRVGRPCPACGDTVRAVEYRRYRVAYCPGCQTGGRVLADNTTSRFLK